MNKRKIHTASLEDIVWLPDVGRITVRELIARLERERELKEQERRKAFVDERRMLFESCWWFYETYGNSVYFYSPAKRCRPDIYGVKDKRVDFYELKAYYMTGKGGKFHYMPMQNVQYEYYFLKKAQQNGELKLPEDIEKYTFNFLITPKTYERVNLTTVSLIRNELCASITKELGYGIYVLKSRNQIVREILPKTFNLDAKNVKERLQILGPFIKEINSLRNT